MEGDSSTGFVCSIITVTYNSAPVLPTFLSSVLESAGYGTEFTLVVVDNNSADSSIDLVRSYAPSATLVANSENVGFGAACNDGARMAHAKGANWLLFLNNDTHFAPDALTRLVDAAAGRGARVASPKILDAGDEGAIWFAGGRVDWLRGMKAVHITDEGPGTRMSEYTTFVSGCALLIDAELFAEIGGFDERFFVYWEDADLSLRLSDRREPVLLARDVIIRHVGGATTGGADSDFSVYQLGYGRMAIILKHATGMRLLYQLVYLACWSGAHVILRMDNWPTTKLRLRAFVTAWRDHRAKT